jgi:hypothetical protein
MVLFLQDYPTREKRRKKFKKADRKALVVEVAAKNKF